MIQRRWRLVAHREAFEVRGTDKTNKQMGRAYKERAIAYFLLEFQALAFVLILKLILLDLNPFQGLDAFFDISRETFNVPRALSDEIRETILDQSEYGGSRRDGSIAIIFLFIIFRDVGDCRT